MKPFSPASAWEACPWARIGGPSGRPKGKAMPLSARITGSLPRHLAYGPVSPNQVTPRRTTPVLPARALSTDLISAGVWPTMTSDLSPVPSRLASALGRSGAIVLPSSSQTAKARPAAPGCETGSPDRSATCTTRAPSWVISRPQ
jgi:hypothetical protein